MMKRSLLTGLILLSALLSVLPAQAAPATPAGLERTFTQRLVPGEPQAAALQTTRVVTGTPGLTGTIRLATLIANAFGIPVDDVLALRLQEIGFGNIVKALFISAQTGVPLEEILAMRAQEIGWGEIRRELGLHPSNASSSLGQIVGRGHNRHGADWVPPGQRNRDNWVPPGQRDRDNGNAPGHGGNGRD